MEVTIRARAGRHLLTVRFAAIHSATTSRTLTVRCATGHACCTFP